MISVHDTPSDPDKPWQYAKNFRLHFTESIDDLEPVILSKVWSPNIFKKNHRTNDNFIASYYMTLDFDDGATSVKEAARIFQDYEGIIGTSKSHGVVSDKNPQGADRFRVIIPWEKPITDPILYTYNMERIFNEYEVDTSCIDRGRFYFPCKEIVACQGGEDFYKFEVKPLPEGFAKKQVDIKLDTILHLQADFKKYRALKPWQRRFLHLGKLPDSGASRRWCMYYIARDLYFCGVDDDTIFRVLFHGNYDKTGIQNLEREVRDRMKSAKRKAASILASIPDAKILPFRGSNNPLPEAREDTQQS